MGVRAMGVRAARCGRRGGRRPPALPRAGAAPAVPRRARDGAPPPRGATATGRCARDAGGASTSTTAAAGDWAALEAAIGRTERVAAEVDAAMRALRDAGRASAWGSAADEQMVRRNVFLNEIKRAGVMDPEAIGKPSVRNDAAFLGTTVVASSVLATLAGVLLPGDWGAFSSYLIGGVSIAVLAVGSTAPGLLQFAIDRFSLVFPDYKDRTLRHEAGHFLVGYLLGVPIGGYSLNLAKEHIDFVEGKLGRSMFVEDLGEQELNVLAVISMAGVAAEGMAFEEVLGQNGDLMDLGRLMRRSARTLSAAEQQSLTRWAVFRACQMLRDNRGAYERLMDAMREKGSVAQCIQAIEAAA